MLEFLFILTISYLLSVFTLIPQTYASKSDKTVQDENLVQRVILYVVPIYILAFGGVILTYLYYALTNKPSRRSFSSPDIEDLIGLFILLFGSLFRLWAMNVLGHYHTFTITVRKSHSLITTGPYKYLRHPSYSGLACIFVSWAILLGNGRINYILGLRDPLHDRLFQLAYIAFAYSFIHLRIKREESVLAKEFGKQWDAFASKRNRIVPFIY